MLGTEVVWHPGIQNVFLCVCVYTTNNDFYLLSTDWFTTRALSIMVSSLTVTWLLTSMYFYFTVARICYQRTKAYTNWKMKKKKVKRVQKVRHGGFDQPYPSTTKRACLENSCFVPLRPTP